LRLAPGGKNLYLAQNRQGMSRNRGCIAECRDADSAAAGVAGRGGMGVGSFQGIKNEDQQNAAQRNPAPQPACLELSSMDDTHPPVWFDCPEYSTRLLQHQPGRCGI
jgi:hypothetical protein